VTKREWAAVVGVSLALRALVGLVWLGSMPLVHDAASYFEAAVGLLTDFPGRAAYYWPPGNAFALASVFSLTGPSVLAARLVMIALGVGGVVLTALLARRLVADVAVASQSPGTTPRTEAIAGWIGALYMPAVLLSGQTYAQHLAAFCLLAFAWLGLRAVDRASLVFAALAGVAFAVGCLTRPSMVSVAPVLLVLWALRMRRVIREHAPLARLAASAGVFLVAAAAIVLPVQAHNRTAGGGFTISTNNERNLFLGNNPYTPDYKTSHLGQRELTDLAPETRDYLRGFYERPDARVAMQHEAIDYIVHHPGVTAYRTFNRATSFWGFDYLGSRIIQEQRGWGKKALLVMLAFEAGAYMLVMALALAGIFAFRAEVDTRARAWLVALAIAYEVPYMLAFSGGTYHFPVVGLLVPFAALALACARARPMRDLLARVAKSRGAVLALVAFVAIQIEYAYYSLAMSG
jgi:4-amino-4-deoxy-L-arabinose transferase-like glycosyltransferase